MNSHLASVKVLVTGAAGFIGSCLLPILLRKGALCCGLDDLSTGCSKPKMHPNLDFRVQDICQPEAVHAIFAGFRPDIVVHLAAVHHIPTCERVPSKAYQTNIVGTQIVLDAAAATGCRKFILASTGGVYDWSEGPLTEDGPIRPTDTYTLSKFTNETQLAFWKAKTGQKAIVARIFNTIGANDRNGHLIPEILAQLNSNGKTSSIQLGNLRTKRDYIHVADTASCLAAMTEYEPEDDVEVFNVGTGKEYGVQFIAETIARIKDRAIEIRSNPTLFRKVDRGTQLADITKTAAKLRWKASLGLEEALKLTVSEEA